MKELKAKEYRRFEDIKQLREDGSEFWSARELAPTLDYTEWRNFNKVIQRAMIACENSGHSVLDDFVEVNKIVEAGATTKPVTDYELSRYACYLIVQNGDPRKEVIALGQTYFAIQAYRREKCSAIEKIGGTMPEDLPTPEKSIQQIEKEHMARLRRKAKEGKLQLDE